MKKTAACLMIMTIIASAVFFYAPVNAATYTGSPAVHKNASGSSQGVTWEINLDQYYPEQNADTGLAAADVYTMVYYRITNSTDQAAYVTNTGFTIQWVTAPYIVSYETYTDNLYLGYQNTSGSWYIYADSPFSYSSGVVVAPHSSLYCVGTIVTSASVNGNTISSQAISSVSLRPASVTLGDYPYGNNGQQLSEIETLLADIKNQLMFTGTIVDPLQSGNVYESKRYDQTGFINFFYIARQPSFVITDESEQLGNQLYQEGYRVIPIYYRVRTDNQYSAGGELKTLRFDYSQFYTPVYLPKVNGVSYIVGDVASNVFDGVVLGMSNASNVYVQLKFKYTDNGRGLIPPGNHFTSFVIYCICPNDVDPVFPAASSWTLQGDNTFTPVDTLFYLNDTFYLRDISLDLAEIKQYLLQQNQDLNDKADDVSENSATLAEQIETIHQEEMAFFEANEEAIEATGLNNFQFNQNHISAFNMITSQFSELWNALSDYTLIFIFTLLLSLATYIIKHEPTTKVKQYRSSVAAERAERISYYSHKNAQARANSGARNDGDSYFWDAVRRNNS